MDAAARQALEIELDELRAREEWESAATRAIKGYGPEILGVLRAMHQDDDEAGEVFQQFCEDLWRGLPAFERRASFRTWAYTLARNASHRRRHKERHVKKQLPISLVVSRVAEKVRTQTFEYLRSQVKSSMRQLRESLPEEDQLLLMLRVDKELGWEELAEVMNGAPLDGEALKRESARLRKRFQLVKEKLRELAQAAGILPSPSPSDDQ
jgi:RNA polymerase sigma-70 factor (ECF subfamily)